MRSRIRTTKRGVTREALQDAAKDVDAGSSIRAVAKSHGICHTTLQRFIVKSKKLKESGSSQLPPVGWSTHKKVFTDAQERELLNYLKTASDMYFGLCPQEVRKLAYQCALAFSCPFPETWRETEMAGKDWFTAFHKRNPSLSIIRKHQATKPQATESQATKTQATKTQATKTQATKTQATSLPRASSSGSDNVRRFYENLQAAYNEHHFEAHDVWSMDETGVMTVQGPKKAVGPRGQRQTAAMTPGKMGGLVTVAMAVNAIGNAIPAFFIFPRKRYQPHFVRDGPNGCTGVGNGSGLMEEGEFLAFLKHFSKYAKPSPASKVLLILDNDSSHVTVGAIDFCKTNSIVMLTLPTHCTHELQPLDRSVLRSFTERVSAEFDTWMTSHPDENATIYHIPSIVAKALPHAATPANIMEGFRETGIWPYSSNIVTATDVAGSSSTHMADPQRAESGPDAAMGPVESQSNMMLSNGNMIPIPYVLVQPITTPAGEFTGLLMED